MKTSAPARWFRLYSEFATDPKVQMLSEVAQRRYIMLLCLRCSNGDVTLHYEEVAFQLRISNEEWAETKAVLMGKKLIDEHGKPTAWDRRQYASDSSAVRVAKHRNKKKQASNVTVTPPETETETETETEPPRLPSVVAPLADAALPPSSAPDAQPAKPARAEKLPPALGVADLVAEGVEKRHAEDWLKVRREKRAPLTRTAWDEVKAEAVKAGISAAEAVRISATNSWQGFKASWMARAAPPRANGRQSPHILPPAGVGAYGEGHVPKDWKPIPNDPNDPVF